MKITTTIVHAETGQTRTVSLPAPPDEYTDAVQTTTVTMPADFPNSGEQVEITIQMVWVPRELLEWIREDLLSLMGEWDYRKHSKYRDEAREWRDLHDRFESVNRLLGE